MTADNPSLPPSVVGEIIEASTTRVVAQCPPDRLHTPPELGTFVKILPVGSRSLTPVVATTFHTLQPEDPFADPVPSIPNRLVLPPTVPDLTLYAIVCAAMTGSADMGRRASAYGLEDTYLREQQPQIYDLLATEFIAIPFGTVRNRKIRPGLPGTPPRLHAFVDACDPDEVCILSETPDFVRHLFHSSGDIPPDDLIAACLTHAYIARNNDFQFLVRSGKQLAMLLRDAPDRLAALLRKLEP